MADKTPQRSPEAIAGDIAAERRALGKALDTLHTEATEAAAADNPTMANARKAVLLVPTVAVAVAAAAGGLIAGLRSQSEKAGTRGPGGKGAAR